MGSDPRSPSPSPSYYSPSYKPSYTAGASNFDGLFKPSLQTAVASRLQRAVQPATNGKYDIIGIEIEFSYFFCI